MDKYPLSRRDFLLRASQAGFAFSILRPPVWLKSDAFDAGAPNDLTKGYAGLRWRMLGPFRGGRVDAVSGVPGRPYEFYFGSVNGGVWKSIDAGRVWFPVFDAQPVASIGALAVAPSAPDVIYVGTGESTLRDSVGYGSGVYKSVDGGKTWTYLGLPETHHIGKIAVDPHNPNNIFVAAIGQLYARNSQRGVFHSIDGGKNWDKVLGTDDVGAVDVVFDPTNSQILFAGLWNTRRPPWYTYAPSNGPGGGIWRSTDAGRTWNHLTNGLPAEGIGRTGIAVAPSNPQRVYAVVDCLVKDANDTAPAAAPGSFAPARGQGGFFRSDNGGDTWTRVSADPALWGRGWYFEKLAIDPTDADVVFVPNVAVNRTMDGGKTWEVVRGSPGGDDYHQMWISAEDPNTAIVASDQGAVITHNAKADARTLTWTSWLNQPTAQIYHVSVDYRFPYWVTGAQQDSGAVAVRSRGKFAQITMRDWEPIGAGGESGYTAGDVSHPGILFGGNGTRYNLETNARVPGTTAPQSTEPARADWTQPLVFSKADHNALYYATQFLFKTSDGAHTWAQISPDLTRPDPGVPPTLDAITAAQTDRNGKRGVIYTISPSPLEAPLIWIGTDDGFIQVTADDGKTWQNVTPAGLGSWSRVTMIEASHFNRNAAFASVDRHQLQDFEPYIYRTRDLGKTWQRITKGLPSGVYVHVVKEDPVRQGMLVAGTERGAFVSFDDGDNWLPLQLNLPATSVRDFEIYQNDLIVATHGRGFWVVDDITPLRQLSPDILVKDVHLFKPADSISFAPAGDNGTPTQKDEPEAPQAPNGAIIDYYLRLDQAGPITLEFLDDKGAVLRAVSSAAPATPQSTNIPTVSPLWRTAPEPLATTAGMHRVVWLPVAPPPANPPAGGGFGRQAQLLTGTFTARLTVNGQAYTQTFVVKPDPRT